MSEGGICPVCKDVYEYKYTDRTQVYYHEEKFCMSEPHLWVYPDGKQLATRNYENNISKFVEVES